MVYSFVSKIRILKKQATKSKNYWMLYEIPIFERKDLKGIKCPYYSFLLKGCK